ncbi:DUF7524 family protein [Halococcus thailandensis]|uniref:Uncharacterized protein n=1 Tax=Halococcus thailandensis JCM 13552 TaxID=1227457 RepID=M0N2N9_9EURY|nr:hypothetical protein [Halococcus thailandensis]EMA50960.1 hypothetical protein C451_16190 [Halococcus thailandensis JCM 13552]
MAESTASGTLSVHLNRAELHAVELPATFASSDSFVVELDNHGEATHVHLRIDDALSEIASIPTSNHYVRPGATVRVPIRVHESGPVTGHLTVATAYGSQTEEVEITIEPTAGKQRVEIDESLIERTDDTVDAGPTSSSTRSTGGTTRSRSTGRTRSNAGSMSRSSSAGGLDSSGLLGATAVVILLGIALLFVEGVAMYIGAVAVLAGLVVAGYLLLS